MSFIVCNNISKTYGRGDSAVSAIDRVDFAIQKHEFLAVMGESGAGKSTLLSVMGAMNNPTTGRYIVDDIDVYTLNSDKRADFRKKYMGFVFQSFHLIPYLTVLENVMLPLAAGRQTRREKKSMATEALAHVGMETKVARLPGRISGGELERAAIARAIVNQPPVLLADEPTGNLDSHTSQTVMQLLDGLNRSGTTIVMVTHSAAYARFAQRTVHIKDGRIAEKPAA